MFLIKIVKFFNIKNPKPPRDFGFFFYFILTFFKKFSNQCLYFLIVVV